MMRLCWSGARVVEFVTVQRTWTVHELRTHLRGLANTWYGVIDDRRVQPDQG